MEFLLIKLWPFIHSFRRLDNFKFEKICIVLLEMFSQENISVTLMYAF
jgi:hypothetical protein